MGIFTRRQLLFSALVGGVLTACSKSKIPEKILSQGGLDIVDSHVHVWTPDTKTYPLAPGFTVKDFWFPSFSKDDLLSYSRPSGVKRINLIQMTWYGLDHRYILDIIANDPEHYVGTGIVPAVTDVSLPGPDKTMVALSQGGIRAFRIRGKSTRPKLGDGDQWLDHPGYEKMFKAAAEYNLALSFLMSPPDLPEVDRMCQRFPESPVIIDHLCLIGRSGLFPEEDIVALCKMARHKKVMIKIGAFYALGKKSPPYLEQLPLIRRVVDAFGPERCMWESDAPLQATESPNTYDSAVALIRDHADFLSSGDKEQILVKTAENFFFR